MPRWSVYTLSLLVAAIVFGCAHGPSDREGWITLIDGASGLANWNRIGSANWRERDGAIHADAGSGYLVSRKVFRDFRVRAEFWAEPDTNSGIFLRVSDPNEITPLNSYEVNIYDQRPDPSYGTGAIVGRAKVAPMPKAGGRWNTYEITAQGPYIAVTLNGVRTAEIHDSSLRSGPIALQSAGGAIKWRKLEVQPLD